MTHEQFYLFGWKRTMISQTILLRQISSGSSAPDIITSSGAWFCEIDSPNFDGVIWSKWLLEVRDSQRDIIEKIWYSIISTAPTASDVGKAHDTVWVPCLRMADRALLAGYPRYVQDRHLKCRVTNICVSEPCHHWFRNRNYYPWKGGLVDLKFWDAKTHIRISDRNQYSFR